MQKLRHHKLRNTGIIYELLTRQLTVDILEDRSESPALKILQKYFKRGTLLNEEFNLYNMLCNSEKNSENKANILIDEVLKFRKKINQKSLAKEKYNIIKEIKEHYDIDKFFSSRIKNFKQLASIYKLFESDDFPENNYIPTSIVQSRYIIIENLINSTDNTPQNIDINLAKFKEQDEEVKLLSYKFLIEKFNEKYSKLDNRQKTLLRKYIDNMSNTNLLREFMDEELIILKEEINENIKKVNNSVIEIKLKEVIKHFDSLSKGNIVKDEQILTMLKLYELTNELDDIAVEM